MNFIQLGKTDLHVSPICLGASQFDTGIDRDFALWQLDAFSDGGGNFIDTALVYGDWMPGEKARSEKLIGQWLKKSGKREKTVIITKGAHPLLETMHVSRCTPGDIQSDIEESLKNLGTEQIDLYLLHRDNPALPVDLLLDALEKARLEGKVKHYGFSNWQLERIKEAEAYTRKTGIEGFTCNQVRWSLAEANVENIPEKSRYPLDCETYNWHCESGCAITAYNSTAGGLFSKMEKTGEIPEKQKKLYDNEANRIIFRRIKEASGDLGHSVHELSLAFIRTHTFSSLPVTSFSRKEQLEEALRSCEINMPESLIKELNMLKGLKP